MPAACVSPKTAQAIFILFCGRVTLALMAVPLAAFGIQPLGSSGAHAAGPSAEADTRPVVAIIIDDMGRRVDAGERAVRLPGPLAYSFLPHAAHTRALARLAHSHNKEVLLHVPMQSVAARPLDKGALRLDMTRTQFVRALEADLAAVPHVRGVNNHMGSLLTRHPGHMLWLMQEINRHGDLFFVDSRTTKHTVARKVAMENDVPSLQRDVFLDHDRRPEAIYSEFERLIKRAQKQGAALAIGHPYPGTLAVLEEMLPKLPERGVRLIPLAEMLQRDQMRRSTWQLSLSPSPKAAKNSKPSPSSTCCAAAASK